MEKDKSYIRKSKTTEITASIKMTLKLPGRDCFYSASMMETRILEDGANEIKEREILQTDLYNCLIDELDNIKKDLGGK